MLVIFCVSAKFRHQALPVQKMQPDFRIERDHVTLEHMLPLGVIIVIRLEVAIA